MMSRHAEIKIEIDTKDEKYGLLMISGVDMELGGDFGLLHSGQHNFGMSLIKH
jgi:hypothetical protein